MDNSFSIALATTIIYILVCFIDMRFLRKEPVPMKIQIRNSVFVFISCMAAIYLLRNIGGEEIAEAGGKSVSAFTGAPGF
jgi:hypothetical protein